MFLAFISQNLNKLVEGKVRDFASPEAFHAIKIQRLGDDGIKPPAQVGCQLPMEVAPLVCDFPIQSRELSDTTPPSVRTFDFPRKRFVEFAEFGQGLFQRFWRLYFLAVAKCQKSTFHTEFDLGIDQIHSLYYIVRTNAFTCCLQRFGIYKVGCDAKPIGTACVASYRYTSYITHPFAVFEEGVRYMIKSPFTILVFSEGQRDTIPCYLPARGARKGHRSELMSLFDMRSTAKFFEKTLIGNVNTFQLLLHGLRRQSVPMWMCRSFAYRQMCSHRVVIRIRQATFVALTLPLMEVFMHLPHIVKQVAKPNTIRLVAKLILIGFHGISSIKFPLTPKQWIGRHVTLRLRWLCLPT